MTVACNLCDKTFDVLFQTEPRSKMLSFFFFIEKFPYTSLLIFYHNSSVMVFIQCYINRKLYWKTTFIAFRRAFIIVYNILKYQQ